MSGCKYDCDALSSVLAMRYRTTYNDQWRRRSDIAVVDVLTVVVHVVVVVVTAIYALTGAAAGAGRAPGLASATSASSNRTNACCTCQSRGQIRVRDRIW